MMQNGWNKCFKEISHHQADQTDKVGDVALKNFNHKWGESLCNLLEFIVFTESKAYSFEIEVNKKIKEGRIKH